MKFSAIAVVFATTLLTLSSSADRTSSPTPSGDFCRRKVAIGSVKGSIWEQTWHSPSCVGEYMSDGFSQCEGDPTSISLDMSKVNKKKACFRYHSIGEFTFNSNEVSEISFDATWDKCGSIWSSPLWYCPEPWKGPQGRSGEIDFIETCKKYPNDSFKTSIICDDHPDPDCVEESWGDAKKSEGPKHFKGTFDFYSGEFKFFKCNLDGTNCYMTSRYPRYLSENYGSLKDLTFHLESDLFNSGKGEEGDFGWPGCGTLNLNTECTYTIANIKVKKHDDILYCGHEQIGENVYSKQRVWVKKPHDDVNKHKLQVLGCSDPGKYKQCCYSCGGFLQGVSKAIDEGWLCQDIPGQGVFLQGARYNQGSEAEL